MPSLRKTLPNLKYKVSYLVFALCFPSERKKQVLDLVQLDRHWRKTCGWSHTQQTEGHFARHQDTQYFWKHLEDTHKPEENEGCNDQARQISISSKILNCHCYSHFIFHNRTSSMKKMSFPFDEPFTIYHFQPSGNYYVNTGFKILAKKVFSLPV